MLHVFHIQEHVPISMEFYEANKPVHIQIIHLRNEFNSLYDITKY